MGETGQSRRLDRIIEYAEAQHARAASEETWHPVFTADYRWEHTLRVAHYGKLIAAQEKLDPEICVAACLLHDIAYFFCDDEQDWRDHGRVGARIARPVLGDAGYSETEVGVISHAIAIHVDGEPDIEHPHTPVADVVSDADNIDRFSAYRVVLWCMTERDDFQKMIAMIRERLERLQTYRARNPLETKAGRELFARQVDLQIGFFEAIIRDAEITRRQKL